MRSVGPMPEPELMTERLALRRFTHADAEFLLRLLNEPAFLKYIGDKGIKTLADAHDYIEQGPLTSYAEHGYGPYRVDRVADGATVGMCGLFKRENLSLPDLGFAFLERFFGNGYATESSLAVILYGREVLRLAELAAVVDPGNRRSIALLEKLGFREEGIYRMPGEDQNLLYYLYRFEPQP